MNFGAAEFLVIALFALIVFGPRRLPELARSAGRALRELRRSADNLTRELKEGFDEELPPPGPRKFPDPGPRD